MSTRTEEQLREIAASEIEVWLKGLRPDLPLLARAHNLSSTQAARVIELIDTVGLIFNWNDDNEETP